MSLNVQALWLMLDHLTTQAESVTFFDAIRLLQQAQSLSEMPPALWELWHGLIRAPHTTDGARALLEDYMRRTMQQTTAQRRLSQQVIRWNASGKTLRLAVGQTTEIALNARPLAGWTWQLQTQPDCITTQQTEKSDMRTSFFHVTAIGTGQGRLVCAEMPLPTPKYRPNTTSKAAPSLQAQQPRTFTLDIIVEPKSITHDADAL